MRKLKSKKGITLIALVITIVILILLAGISIAILGGEDGLINKAKEAGRKQKIAEIKEKIGLELMAAETDAIIRGEQLEVAQRNDIASKYGTVNGDILTIDGTEYQIDLKQVYNKTLSESGSYTALKQVLANTQQDLATSQADLATAQMSQSEAGAALAELQTTIASMTVSPADVSSTKTIYDTSDGTVKNGTKSYEDIYTYPANSTGAQFDLGINNNYRYVNAANVYEKGKEDGQAASTKTFTVSASTRNWYYETGHAKYELIVYVNGNQVASKTLAQPSYDGHSQFTVSGSYTL